MTGGREVMFGLETEYGVAGGDPGRREQSERLGVGYRLLGLARSRYPTLSDGSATGMFMANGGRFYVDAGEHPEMCTPECGEPWELVAFAAAGDRIVAGLARELGAATGGPPVQVLKTNVDYVNRETWGSHESYLSTFSPTQFSSVLIPHLVSRIVYTGAGGFDASSAGVRFMVSPRAQFTRVAASGGSTSHRPIFHTKDESLGNAGWHRLHVISGESLCSGIGLFLRFGATALILRLAEHGLLDSAKFNLARPVKAFCTFANDFSLCAEAALESGERRTALDIQRMYLEETLKHVDAPFMPVWAGAVCTEWGRVLDGLQTDPRTLSTELDWLIKRNLFDTHLRAHGYDLQTLAQMSARIDRAVRAGLRSENDSAESRLRRLLDDILMPLIDRDNTRLRQLELAGFERRGLDAIVALRNQLAELDCRFGELTGGIYDKLQQDGLLAEGPVAYERIEAAMHTPPASGRARVRGNAIAELAARGHAAAEWQAVFDHQKNRVLDLRNPFVESAKWEGLSSRRRRRRGGTDAIEAGLDLIGRL